MRTVGLVAALVLVGGCGDRAVDGDYLGEALFAVEGTVALSTTAGGPSGELRAALFWARPSADSTTPLFDSVTAVEQDVGAASTFPARYSLTIHQPPPDALIATASDVTGRFATAMILVYLDVDGDGTWDRGVESLVGAARDAMLVFAPDGLGGGRFGALAPGFHLLTATTAATTVTCGTALTEGDASNVPIVVDMRFPGNALGDLNCDGVANEWAGTCPSLSDVWSECREHPDPDDDGLCATCDGLLWDEQPNADQCASWSALCENLTADSHECQEAREHCDGEAHEACLPGDDDCVPPP